MSGEAQRWVLAASRCEPGSEPGFVADAGEWEAALEYAESLHCGLLAAVALSRAPWRAKAPGDIVLGADARVARERMWLGALDVELERVATALAAEGIPVLVLKGMDLGRRVYPERILRAMADIDLLVAPEDYERALAALEAAGYLPVGEARPGRFRGELARGPGHPVIELHHALLEGDSREWLDGLRERAVAFGRAAGPVTRLADEDNLVYLLRHAGIQHCFESPAWLNDLHFLIAASPRIDWGRVVARIIEARAVSAAYLAFLLLGREWGTPIPATALSALRVRLGMARERLLDVAARSERWFVSSPRGPAQVALRRILLRDGLGDVIRYTVGWVGRQLGDPG